jgi:hypothetical protein
MKGYRKIGSGDVRCDRRMCIEENDNYELDCQIRSVVHSAIIGETNKSGIEDFYVVVYKKVVK